MRRVTKTIRQTHKLAKWLVKKLLEFNSNSKSAVVIGLLGDLGSGKTTFTQGLAKALGIKEKVVSPTFVILKRYKRQETRDKYLIHIDAYRIDNPQEILALGWKEMVGNPENIIVIEWAEKIKKILPKKRILIYFNHKSQKERAIDIRSIK